MKTTKKTPQRASYRRFFGFFAAECLSVFSSICCAYTIAAEQKARATYDNILKLADDPDVIEPIKFLREREVVHYQRFGEANHTNLRRMFPYKMCLDGVVKAL